jgi:serine/threonine protein kinase
MERGANPSLLQPGTVIGGRYEVLRALGSGGMGTVLLVKDDALGEEIAIKLLYPHLAQDKTTFARFRNELLIARRLSHPNIVRLYDIGNAGGGYYFISMELVTGGSLTKRIYDRENPLAFDETLRILRGIATGIGHAHSQGVVHRDLKPDNVMLTEDSQVKVTDFGLARNLFSDNGFTATGEAVGTPYYMAPEQLRGEKVDGRCDIYALGLIAYEMVVGKRPFFEESYLELATLHLRAPIPNFATKESGIPQWFEDFVKRCAEKRPENRFQTAEEIVDLLGERLSSMRGKKSRKKQPSILVGPGVSRSGSKATWKPVAVTFGIMFLTTGGVFAALRGSTNSAKSGWLQSRLSSWFSPSGSPEDLIAAVEHGETQGAMRLLTAGVEANSANALGRTALYLAVESGKLDIARMLLEHGADPNAGDAVTKNSPLMAAVRDEARIPLVPELIRRGADVDERNAELRTALMFAAEAGSDQAVQALLDRNAVIAARDNLSRNALMYAVRNGHAKVAALLLRKPIDLEAADTEGKTALFYAVQQDDETIATMLLNAGANPAAADNSGRTVQDYATSKNRKLLRGYLNR